MSDINKSTEHWSDIFMNIAGIDYSLRGPAVCVFAGDYETEFSFKKCTFYFLTDIKKYCKTWNNVHGECFSDYDEEPERYETIADWAIEKLTGVHHISLEGYSFGSQSSRLFQIAENTGLLKYKIFHRSIPLDVVPPSQVKKFASGKGNANKDKMIETFKEETSIDLRKMLGVTGKSPGPVADVVDSYYVCKLLHSQLQKQKSN